MLGGFSQSAATALDAIGIAAADALGLTGAGIAIGLPDYGFDVLHPALRMPNHGKTRLAALWDQASARAFDRAGIDQLITAATDSGNRAVADHAYDPHANYYGRNGVVGGAHGTHMASIAAGSRVDDYRGVAPEADLIAVHLDLPDHDWKEENAEGEPSWLGWARGDATNFEGWRSYDDSASIVRALHFIHEQACLQRRPGLVVNVSVGTWAGAHDGASSVELALADLARTTRGYAREPACAVVVGAGNAGADGGHVSGVATPAMPAQFDWAMDAGDVSQNKLEIWYEAKSGADVRLWYVNQTCAIDLTPGGTHRVMVDGAVVGIAEHAANVRGRLSRVRLLLHPPLFPARMRAGGGAIRWNIEIAPKSVRETARVEAWVERDDGYPIRSTLHPNAREGTLCAFACAPGAIVVGGYDASIAGRSGPFAPSGGGPLPWSKHSADAMPLITAPAHRIWGAVSKTNGYAPTSGTSAAAALGSGVVALLMQQQLRATGAIDVAAIRQLLADRAVAFGAHGSGGRIRFPSFSSESARERVAAH